MKLTQSEFEEIYEFWKLDKLDQIKAYVDYFIKEELPDIKRYQTTAPAYQRLFRENCDKLYYLFKERVNLQEVLSYSSKNIAYIIIYISGGISYIGLTFLDLERFTGHAQIQDEILDHLLNKIEILDWYKKTMAYKEWQQRQQLKQKFDNKEETEQERARRIAILRKSIISKVKSDKYTQDRLLRGLK